MSENRRLIVTVSGERELADVTADLVAHGFTPEQVLSLSGIVIGAAAESDIPALQQIEGVSDVASDEPIDIGPPDAPVS